MRSMEMLGPALSSDDLTRGLQTRVLGRHVVYRETVNSTNDIAKELADSGEPEGTLVIADKQTAGRGRLGRSWIAPARSSILMSLILRPVLAPHQLARAVMPLALGACDAVRTETGLDAALKWPNDILLNEHKCGGILAEAGVAGEEVEYVVAGLGMNVNLDMRAIAGIPADATTIAQELGNPFPRERLVRAILEKTEYYYERLKAGENLRSEWSARLSTLHRPIHVLTPWGEEVGIAASVDDDGALLLRRADGSMVTLVAGDVTLSSNP